MSRTCSSIRRHVHFDSRRANCLAEVCGVPLRRRWPTGSCAPDDDGGVGSDVVAEERQSVDAVRVDFGYAGGEEVGWGRGEERGKTCNVKLM